MASKPSHEPKLAALEAYRDQRLSIAGRARVERHLAECELCRESLVGMRRFERLLSASHETAPPEIDWSRMELPLRREATRLSRNRRLRRAFTFLAFGAAASIGLFLAREPAREAPSARVALAPVPSPLPQLSAPQLGLRITAIVGAVDGVDPEGRRAPMNLASSPSEGWVIETGALSELHLDLDRTAALLVLPGSSLALRHVRDGEVLLELTRGQVISHVQKLAARSSYEIAASGHRVAVRGTRFSVEHAERGLAVQVDEGVVAVLQGNGDLVTELRAPGRWNEGTDAAQRAPRFRTKPLREPRETRPEGRGWPVLEVPQWPHVASWDIDGAELGAGGLLQMRVPVGDIDIGARLDDGRRMTTRIRVDPIGARFDPRALRWVGPPKPRVDSPPSSTRLNLSSASLVIHRSEAALQHCYERALRAQPDGAPLALRARVKLVLDPTGHVKQVEMLAPGKDSLPRLLDDCVRRVALGWQFSIPPGEGITFEAPISFRPAQQH